MAKKKPEAVPDERPKMKQLKLFPTIAELPREPDIEQAEVGNLVFDSMPVELELKGAKLAAVLDILDELLGGQVLEAQLQVTKQGTAVRMRGLKVSKESALDLAHSGMSRMMLGEVVEK